MPTDLPNPGADEWRKTHNLLPKIHGGFVVKIQGKETRELFFCDAAEAHHQQKKERRPYDQWHR